MKTPTLIFILATSLTPLVNAQEDRRGGLFIEPAVTYETGDTSTDYPPAFSDSTGSLKGFGIGARLGFHINEAFFLALDGRYSQPDFSDSSVNYDAKAVSTSLGPVIGLQTPVVGLRVWAASVLSAELNPESDNNFDVKYRDGTGYRVGAGFRIASVSLNAEYEETKYDKATLEQAGSFTPGTIFDDVELKNKTWITSVSFPFQF